MATIHDQPEADIVLRVKALGSLLVEKGLVDPQALDALVVTICPNNSITSSGWLLARNY